MPKAKEETPTKKLKKSIMPSELVAEKMASVASILFSTSEAKQNSTKTLPFTTCVYVFYANKYRNIQITSTHQPKFAVDRLFRRMSLVWQDNSQNGHHQLLWTLKPSIHFSIYPFARLLSCYLSSLFTCVSIELQKRIMFFYAKVM